ncbi:hypothetical protein KI387_003571, partial [Taxus chinensis]
FKVVSTGIVGPAKGFVETTVPKKKKKPRKPKMSVYHFYPPEFLHPVTVIYDLSYGETETNKILRR